ncbi:MAG: DUF3592 domain-containing protein [Pseudomonadota bacterium]
MIVKLLQHFGFWVAVAFVGGGGTFMAIVGHEQYRESQFESSGTVAAGSVLSKRIETDYDEGRRYDTPMIAFRFKPANGSPVTGESKIRPGLYETLKAGDQIDVLYLPDDPETNRLVSAQPMSGSGAAVIMGLGGLFVLLGLLLLRAVVRQTAKESV